MRKTVWMILIFVVAFCIGLVVMPKSKPKDVPKELLLLPSIDLLLIDSTTIINTSQAPKNRAIVLFYFDPNCHHCQRETEDIIANKSILKMVNFYFISLDSMGRIKKFMEHYRLKQFPEILVTKDYQYKALSGLQIRSIPTNLVYDSEHKIAKIFGGGMSIESLKKVL